MDRTEKEGKAKSLRIYKAEILLQLNILRFFKI